jgi:hypothetical protein
VKLRNDKPALKAKCECCCNLTKFVKSDSVEKVAEKFGKCKTVSSKRKSPMKKNLNLSMEPCLNPER